MNSARLEVQLKGPNFQLGENGDVTFAGAGLNDLTAGGTPGNGAPARSYKVQIDGEGTPDTFKWSDDGGATWKEEAVEITGVEQSLQEGVTATFGATTGHTTGNYWTWSTSYSGGAIYADGSAGIYGAFGGGLVMVNCTAKSIGKVLDLKCLNAVVTLLHCSLYAEDSVLTLDDDGTSKFLDVILLNNILHTPTASKYCLTSNFDLNLIHSNGNCYYFPGAAAALSNLAATLALWRTRFGQDVHSINLDPKMIDPFNGDWTLAEDSPCRMRGRTVTNAGIEGNERAFTIDIGAYQDSLAQNWSIKAEGGQIIARIEGRIPVEGI